MENQSARIINVSMLASSCSNVFLSTLLETITCCKKNYSTVKMADKHAINSKRREKSRNTDQGCNL